MICSHCNNEYDGEVYARDNFGTFFICPNCGNTSEFVLPADVYCIECTGKRTRNFLNSNNIAKGVCVKDKKTLIAVWKMLFKDFADTYYSVYDKENKIITCGIFRKEDLSLIKKYKGK